MAGVNLRWAALVGAVTALAVAALVVSIRSAAPPPALEVKLPDAPAADGVLKVYITGAVVNPGIYQLQAGQRYADAITAAGGPTADAEPLAVNMARRVRDEEQIHVPRTGEAAQGALTSHDAPLDLNTATAAQLDVLPGIGPVRAQKIIESRAKDGPFTKPEDLVQRKLTPQSTLDAMRDMVQVRP